VKSSRILSLISALLVASCVSLWAQATSGQFGFGQFSPPTLRKPPVTGMLTLTPATVQPRSIDLGPQAITQQSAVKPSEINLNRVAPPAPALPSATAAKAPAIDNKPTGLWAPPPVTNSLALQYEPVTSILDHPATPKGLGNTTTTDDSGVDWRVVTPVDVPMTYVPFKTAPVTKEVNFWNTPPKAAAKTPKYQWK
jgi:hypothetical protein